MGEKSCQGSSEPAHASAEGPAQESLRHPTMATMSQMGDECETSGSEATPDKTSLWYDNILETPPPSLVDCSRKSHGKRGGKVKTKKTSPVRTASSTVCGFEQEAEIARGRAERAELEAEVRALKVALKDRHEACVALLLHA